MPMPVPFVKDIEFEYGKVQQVTPLIRRIIAHNPGPVSYTHLTLPTIYSV